MPSPGEKRAQCGVSASSVFSQNIYPPASGWVGIGETFEIPSTRLGEVAIVCYGGYESATGVFTATALGVRRHVYAMAGEFIDGLDVTLSHPLDTTFEFRVLEAPTWPQGVQTPSITLSLDLGPDGAIPMTRTVYGGDNNIWRAPRQLGELSGDLYDASYTVYARISADTPTSQPAAYTFEDKLKSLIETHIPYWDGESWALEPTSLEGDLHAVWSDPDSGRYTAVGAGGALLFHNGLSWYPQSSGSHERLRAIDGRSWDDQWVAGDQGTVLHWDGLAWQHVEAPADNYYAIVTTSDGALWLAGDVRLRRRSADGSWGIEGPPSLQGVKGLASSNTGHLVAVGEGGKVYLRGPSGGWSALTTPVTSRLVDVSIRSDDGEFVVVGDHGVILIGHLDGGSMELAPSITSLDLTAVTHNPSGVMIGGDAGSVIRRVDGQWNLETIPGYSNKLQGVSCRDAETSCRIVGSASHTLGPFLGYPLLDAPEADPQSGALTLSWSYDSGQQAEYTQLRLSTAKYAPAFWTLVVGRGVSQVTLPDLSLLAGVQGLGSGTRSVEIQRVRNGLFDIDDYTTREFSIYLRESWSRNQIEFYAP